MRATEEPGLLESGVTKETTLGWDFGAGLCCPAGHKDLALKTGGSRAGNLAMIVQLSGGSGKKMTKS